MKIFLLSLLVIFSMTSCQKETPLTIKGKKHQVTLTQKPASFPVNDLFSFTFAADTTQTQTIKVDCVMPHHGHGMNTQTVVESLGANKFNVKGMQLHMEGHWLLSFEIFENNQLQERLEYPFEL